MISINWPADQSAEPLIELTVAMWANQWAGLSIEMSADQLAVSLIQI